VPDLLAVHLITLYPPAWVSCILHKGSLPKPQQFCINNGPVDKW
jgi:hypothetical protein